ncbi:response regulator transcription factor [Thiomicrorhabdus aquaedulcis]|uniref:response regulator transcription factor n=1 Tax=Thiomicrorhabdus aquaedulcis TaxID=2211106 RepID=UPI000FD7A550|nr:LuxR C-terminal-related transcriptional regulator [Thiomicrorhabdus aquaedulcis]
MQQANQTTLQPIKNTWSEPDIEDDAVFLQKVVHIQSCLINGHSLEALLHQEVPFIEQVTGCKLAIICLNHHHQLHFEFVLDQERQLLKNLRKINAKPKHFSLKNFIRLHGLKLNNHKGHFILSSLEDFFDGDIPRAQCQELEASMGFESAVAFPIFSFAEQKFGCVVYIYQHNHTPNLVNLYKITAMLQLIFRPLYDEQNDAFYSKCICVNTDTPELTQTEQKVIKWVLSGTPYPQIANELCVSLNTVKTHVKNIFNKYNVNSKLELYNCVNNHNGNGKGEVLDMKKQGL